MDKSSGETDENDKAEGVDQYWKDSGIVVRKYFIYVTLIYIFHQLQAIKQTYINEDVRVE